MAAQRLNLMQRLLRGWEAVHPYNAAQIVTVRGTLDATAVETAWAGAVATLGVSGMPIPLGTVRVLPPSTSIAAYLNAEMNATFGEPAAFPFRPFVMLRGDGTRDCGIVYRHWVADSVSIRRLLAEWVARSTPTVVTVADTPSAPAICRASAGAENGRQIGYAAMCGRRHSPAGWVGHFLDLCRGLTRLRQARKPISGENDYRVRVRMAEMPSGLGGELRSECRGRGLNVSDVLLAALAEACAQHVPLQSGTRRRDVAVGNIVDLRPYRGRSLDAFGLCLGFTNAVCDPAALADWPRLLRTIAAQGRLHRRAGVTHSSTAWWAVALAFQCLMRRERIYRFYRKQMPLAGGLSNVRLDALSPSLNGSPSVLGYVRISPTGPVAPVALSTTTLADHMQVALTYRSAIVSDAAAEALLDQFKCRIARGGGEKC